jgi:hypothetical protein
MTTLSPHTRGDTFEYSFTLDSPYSGSTFTGGVKFTLRQSVPDSSEETDTEAVDQASVDTGEITFDGSTGTILIPSTRTTSWPTGKLYYDLQGVISTSPVTVYTLASGQILIRPDITRST